MDDRSAHLLIFILGFCCFPGVIIVFITVYQILSKMLRPFFKFFTAFCQFLIKYRAENDDEE